MINASLGFIGPLILGKHMHYWTVLMIVLYYLFLGINEHCGYDFPWTMQGILPLSRNASYHEYHHTYPNNGNYSCILWDTIFGTNTKYLEYIKKQDEKKQE